MASEYKFDQRLDVASGISRFGPEHLSKKMWRHSFNFRHREGTVTQIPLVKTYATLAATTDTAIPAWSDICSRLNTYLPSSENFLTNVNSNGPIYDIQIDSNERIYLVGNFTSIGGKATEGIAKLLPDGLWCEPFDGVTYGYPVVNGAYPVEITRANRVRLMPNDKILVFQSNAGVTPPIGYRAIKHPLWAADGSGVYTSAVLIDPTTGEKDSVFRAWYSWTGVNFNGVGLRSIVQRPDGAIVVSWAADYPNVSVAWAPYTMYGLCLLTNRGSLDDASVKYGYQGSRTVAPSDLKNDLEVDNYIYASGVTTNPALAYGICHLDSVLGLDAGFSTLASSTDAGTSGYVGLMQFSPPRNRIFAGSINNNVGQTWKWKGSATATHRLVYNVSTAGVGGWDLTAHVQYTPAFNSYIIVLAVDGNYVYCMGVGVQTVDGVTVDTTCAVFRLTYAGVLDTTYQAYLYGGGSPFTGGLVHAGALTNDGKLILVGSFTHYKGTQVNYICRLDETGSLDT